MTKYEIEKLYNIGPGDEPTEGGDGSGPGDIDD